MKADRAHPVRLRLFPSAFIVLVLMLRAPLAELDALFCRGLSALDADAVSDALPSFLPHGSVVLLGAGGTSPPARNIDWLAAKNASSFTDHPLIPFTL